MSSRQLVVEIDGCSKPQLAISAASYLLAGGESSRLILLFGGESLHAPVTDSVNTDLKVETFTLVIDFA